MWPPTVGCLVRPVSCAPECYTPEGDLAPGTGPAWARLRYPAPSGGRDRREAMVAYVDDVATDPDESRSSIQAVARPGQRHRQGVTKHGVGDNRTGVDDGVSSSDRGEVGGDGGEGVHAGVHGGRGRRGGAGGGERGDGGTVTATVSVVWEDGSEEDGVKPKP